MINQLILKNFTTFNHKGISVDFSPKINVIIGENGTGKTHLLKAAYSLCAGAPLFKNKPDTSEDDLQSTLTTKLVRVLMPLDEKLGKLHHQGATEQTYLQAQFDQDQKITVTFFNNSKSIAIQNRRNYEKYQAESVYIPTKEVLSFMKGFNSLYEKYGLSFDQTYQDICLLLDLPQIRAENLHEKSKWAMDEIKRICGGSFIFYGGGNVTFKNENTEFSANAMAEGFRKLGILSRLLETGAIQPGISGPLFWDEPESNLNPKLMGTLVQILLELSRHGQQIVLATHDYLLLKWLTVHMDKDKGDHVRFHALDKDEHTGEIKIYSTDDYFEIEKNPISEAYNQLTIAHAQSRLKRG